MVCESGSGSEGGGPGTGSGGCGSGSGGCGSGSGPEWFQIFSHGNPDSDTVGLIVRLYMLSEYSGVNCKVIYVE